MRWYNHSLLMLALCLSTTLFAQVPATNEDETPLESYQHRVSSQAWQSLLSFRKPHLDVLLEYLKENRDEPEIRQLLNREDMLETAWGYIASLEEKPTSGGFKTSLKRSFPSVTYIRFLREPGQSNTFTLQMRTMENYTHYLEIRRATFQESEWSTFENSRSNWEHIRGVGNYDFFERNQFTYSSIYGMPRLVIPSREQKDYYDLEVGSGQRIRLTEKTRLSFASNKGDECLQNPDAITHSIEPELGDCFKVLPGNNQEYLICNSQKEYYTFNQCNPSELAKYDQGCRHVTFEYHVYLKAPDARANTHRDFIAASQ